MIFVVGVIILVVFLLSTSGETAETSVLGLETPVIPATPVEKEPEIYYAPVANGNGGEPVSTFLPMAQ